jgi:hypothetical protein
MPRLSKAAQKSLKNTGSYKCKAPSKPYRIVVMSMTGLSSYNKLYVKAFMEGVNSGDCYRHEDGTVTSRACHWVKAVATTDPNDGFKAAVYFTTSPAAPIGFIVDDSYIGMDALTVKDLDIMSDGMYGSEKKYKCEDEDGHDGEECTCHRRPEWNGVSWEVQ